MRRTFAGTGTEVGGALGACEALAALAVPFFWAGAVPGPTVSAAARLALWERFLARLEEALPLDGLVLALHGAMVAEDVEDPESDLLAHVRERVGSVPVAVVLDLHGNPGNGLIEEADIALAYETASLLPGYAYADVARLGFAVVATGEGSAASDAADEIAERVW